MFFFFFKQVKTGGGHHLVDSHVKSEMFTDDPKKNAGEGWRTARDRRRLCEAGKGKFSIVSCSEGRSVQTLQISEGDKDRELS